MTSPKPQNSKKRSKNSEKSNKIRGLTPLRLAFCLAYVALGGDTERGNAGKAYVEAGYAAANSDVAAKEGHKLLNIPEVNREIRRLWGVLEDKKIVDIGYVVSNLKLMVDASIKDFISITPEGVVPKSLEEIGDQQAKAIKSFKYRKSKDGSISWEVALHDRTQPLIKLGEYIGAFSDFNQALAVMRKYEFDVVKVDGGYFLKDLNAEQPEDSPFINEESDEEEE